MKYILKPLSIYELGQRTNQEDSIYPEMGKATPDDRLFIVCDGMGGHDSGEIASQTVCKTMSQYVLSYLSSEDTFTTEQFNQALSAAYDALDEKDNGATKKMGTTMTFLKFHREGCLLAHIGDSRIYHIRPSKKDLFHTKDHSLVNDLVDIGELTPEEAKTSNQKNVITRAMQPNLDKRPKADIKHITDIRPGDYFFMCSDGMLEETEDSDLLNILSDPETSDEGKLEILTKVSENNRDNHSAYLIHVMDVISEKEKQTPDSVPQKDDSEFIPSENKTATDIPASPQANKRTLKMLKTVLFLVILFSIIYIAATYLLEFFKAKGV